jgi:hypothetical protein
MATSEVALRAKGVGARTAGKAMELRVGLFCRLKAIAVAAARSRATSGSDA